MKDGVSLRKSKLFAIRIVRLYQHLSTNKKQYVLSKQLLKSGTSIGALLTEAEHAQSKADFLDKANVALKEANETIYWLELLLETDYLIQKEFDSLFKDAEELLKLLIATVKKPRLILKDKQAIHLYPLSSILSHLSTN